MRFTEFNLFVDCIRDMVIRLAGRYKLNYLLEKCERIMELRYEDIERDYM